MINGPILRCLALALALGLAASPALASGAARPTIERAADLRPDASVRLTGEVIRVIDRAEFRLADATGSAPVRLAWDGPSPVAAGDRVTVEGVVEDAGVFGVFRPEIRATSLRLPSGAVILFESATEPSVEREPADASSRAAPIASLRRGQSATIRGEIVRLLDRDEFRLADASGSIRVYVGWRNRVPGRVGDVVTVTGVVDDDAWPRRPEFYASSVITAAGERVALGREAASETGAPGGEPAAAPSRPATSTPIAELRAYETVLVEGVVERLLDEDEFRLRDETGSVRVYIGWRNAMPVASGERVSVVGLVDADGPGGLFREIYASEILLADGRTVRLRGAASADPRSAAPAPAPRVAEVVTPIDQVRRGQRVALAGVVDRIRDSDEFILRDESGRIEISIGWRNAMPVIVGERVTVYGVADDDVFPGRRPDVYAERILKADGSLVTLDRRDD